MLRKFLISVLFACTICAGRVSAMTFPDETLRYDIVYHWGMIWKHAGSAELSIRRHGENYDAVLAARTISWADKVFRVRDTLSCTMRRDGLRPLVYKKATHEGKHRGLDIVEYTYSGGGTGAECSRIRPERQPQRISLHAQGQAYDMLSIFYFLRGLDFDGAKAGETITVTVFSGKRKERLDIRYISVEDVELRDKSSRRAHHITFTFTQDGQKKTSDDMHTWISVEKSRTPLMMKGKLPVGEVRCYLSKQH